MNETYQLETGKINNNHHLNLLNNKELRPFTKLFGDITLNDFTFNPDKDTLGTGKFGKIFKALWKSKNK